MPEDDEDLKDDQDDGTDDSGGQDDDKGTGSGDDKGTKDDSELARARREAAKYRRQLREAQQAGNKASDDRVRKVLEALGVKDTEDIDPEKLREQTKRQAETLRQRTVELAVLRAASRNGADPETLMDSRSFLEDLADLDPADEDFNAQVADKIKAAVKKNPRFKGGAQVVAGSSGGAHGSGSGTGSGSDDKAEESAEDAYKAVLKRRTKT